MISRKEEEIEENMKDQRKVIDKGPTADLLDSVSKAVCLSGSEEDESFR